MEGRKREMDKTRTCRQLSSDEQRKGKKAKGVKGVISNERRGKTESVRKRGDKGDEISEECFKKSWLASGGGRKEGRKEKRKKCRQEEMQFDTNWKGKVDMKN